MNTWDMSKIAVEAERALGLSIRQEFDLDAIPRILSDMGKEYVSPILDPSKNDFTPSNCFWLVAEDDGKPVMVGGVRLDDLGQLDVKKFWARMLARTFGEEPAAQYLPFPPDVLTGRIAYFGDLFSIAGNGLTRAGRERLRLFTTVGHYLTQLEFRPNATYSFIQDRDIARGTPALYGFLDLHPFLYSWDVDPYPAGCPEWIACTPQDRMPYLMAGVHRFIEGLARRKLEGS
ncbi:hypothetical protein Q4578_16720 [Shimia thalassica]|uniref:hypothetical protein n=1 Tax=Shimia thalassica TaxID=1715693 RepID=UPI0026E1FBAA|nr:hypothetical protein [Shimia thalassica]MDO6523242.1 hypothetical protein [Shimia thalassica]